LRLMLVALAAMGWAVLSGVALGTAAPSARADSTDVPALDAGGVVVVHPAEGFRHPYLLYVPRATPRGEPVRMLVEPNNTGRTSDDPDVHLAEARKLASRWTPRRVADSIRSPLLVPVFPRPESMGSTYTHALDRDTMRIAEGELARLDLQLIAMIEHARAVLGAIGVETKDRVFMSGYSASGTFVNRFTVLHPSRVRAVAAGGVNGIPILPVESLGGVRLEYPIGAADIERYVEGGLDTDGLASVSQRVYMGAMDRNDTFPFGDAWDDDEREVIAAALGEVMMPDRWARCQEILADSGLPIQCVTYEGTGHEIRPEMVQDLAAFFLANDVDGFEPTSTFEYEPVELATLSVGHIDGLVWADDPRVPAHLRSGLPEGSFIVSISDWIPERDHRQLDELREAAGFSFALTGERGGEVRIATEHLWGTTSTNEGSFQGFVVLLGAEDRAALAGLGACEIAVEGPGRPGARWEVGSGVRLAPRGD